MPTKRTRQKAEPTEAQPVAGPVVAQPVVEPTVAQPVVVVPQPADIEPIQLDVEPKAEVAEQILPKEPEESKAVVQQDAEAAVTVALPIAKESASEPDAPALYTVKISVMASGKQYFEGELVSHEKLSKLIGEKGIDHLKLHKAIE